MVQRNRRIYQTVVLHSIALAMLMAAGCASWTSGTTDSHKIDPNISSTESSGAAPSIVVEFRSIKPDEADNDESIWQWVDETRIDSRQRQRLLANGIRTGIVNNSDGFFHDLDQRMVESGVMDEFLSEASISSTLTEGVERIPLRYGHRTELALRQPFEGEQVTLVNIDGQTEGKTLLRPQPIFAIEASRATSPNQIEINFRPEIQHGELKQKWVSSHSAIRIDARRESWSLVDLSLDAVVNEDDLLVITTDTPIKGLGKQFFTGEAADDGLLQVMLLVEVKGLVNQ